MHEGDILNESWHCEPIEYLFVDIAKSYRVLDHLLLTFFPTLIPSRSLVVMQDYLWLTAGPWHHIVFEKLNGYFDDLEVFAGPWPETVAVPRSRSQGGDARTRVGGHHPCARPMREVSSAVAPVTPGPDAVPLMADVALEAIAQGSINQVAPTG